MAIIVRDVPDADIQRACEIEIQAYSGGALSPILAPGPFPPDALLQRTTQMIDMRKEDPTAVYIQAVDEETGKMIAFAKWHVLETPDQAGKSTRPTSYGPGRNAEACSLFFGGMAEGKKRVMGDTPHLYLHMLHADPNFQGRGAGSKLIEWGTKKSDELGLPAFLESSVKGHELYKKHGFEDVEILKFDFSPFGGSVHEQPLMRREPAKSS